LPSAPLPPVAVLQAERVSSSTPPKTFGKLFDLLEAEKLAVT
jgi:hypothetical protein